MRLGAAGDQPGERVERGFDDAVKGKLVHLVEGAIHQARKNALDPEALSEQDSHQIAYGRVFAERDQRAEIPVAPFLQRLAGETPPDLLEQMGCLLMGGLGARRDSLSLMPGPGTR